MFQKGHKLSKGGFRPGAGRPKDEFIEWCQKTINSPKARRFVEDLVTGEPIEEKVLDTPNGIPQKLMVSAPAAARLKAIEFLASYSWGKPVQGIQAVDEDGKPMNWSVVNYASLASNGNGNGHGHK